MTFLKSLFNRIFSAAESRELQEPGDHFERLVYLQKHHEWIDVTVSRTEQRYQSLILDIDIENKELLIDELYPPDNPPNNLDHLQAGDTLEIISRSKHMPVSFFTRLLARELNDGETLYRLELPEEIGVNQSRGAYRVYVENETGLDIDIHLEDSPLAAVRIINLSTDGIKLFFPQDMTQKLTHQRHFPNCIIRLPTGVDIDCEIELRNLYAIHTPRLHSLGGGKLTVHQPQHRVKLQQYLASVQRRQRRMEYRES